MGDNAIVKLRWVGPSHDAKLQFRTRMGWADTPHIPVEPVEDRRIVVDDGLRRALAVMGGLSPLARALGLTPQAVSAWRQVPPRHVLKLETITGLSRETLRPDLYTPASARKKR